MPAKLIEVEEARRLVLAGAVPLGTERVPLRASLGRVLAEDARGVEPVPAFDNSAMDGFALRAADTAGASPESPASLALVGKSRAGDPAAEAVRDGEAIAISTGAAIPEGADAVVRVEDTASTDGRVEIQVEVEPGHDIRRAGDDIRPGTVVLRSGTELGPAELGVLASLGVAQAPCSRRPRLRVVTTGDELLDPGEPTRPGGVRNTNAYALPLLGEEAGAEPVGVEAVGDDAAATIGAIERSLDAEVTVITGGVSVGEHDHVKGALSDLGCEEVFWGVALRPGRPTWFGRSPTGGLVFGLPGNPVSAVVTFILFARPAIRAVLGADPLATRATAILDEGYAKRRGRAHAVRCALTIADGRLHARPTGPQGSHVLTSMLGAGALAWIPAGSEGVGAGERVEVELLPGPLRLGSASGPASLAR